MAIQDRLLDNLRVSLPGATDAGIAMNLWNVLDYVCRRGWLWDETYPLPLLAGNSVYDAPAPTGSVVVEVTSLDHNTLNLACVVVEYTKIILKTDATTVDVTSGPLYVSMILAPSLEVQNEDIEGWVPEDIWRDHFAMLKHGVLGHMMAEPAKPYSSPQLAAFHMRSFNGMVASARVKARNGGQVGNQRWSFPRGWGNAR